MEVTLSGGTPKFSASNTVRHRHSNSGYGSSGDDLEDDASSQSVEAFRTSSMDGRGFGISSVFELAFWLLSSAFIVYYGDGRSNFVSLLIWDDRIKRGAFNFGSVCVVLNSGIVFTTWWRTKDNEIFDGSTSTAVQVVVMTGLVSFTLFSVAHWPIWKFLTLPLLVDTESYFRRVDAGLKTVAGGKKFLPATKHCIQPDVKPSIHSSINKAIRRDRSRGQSPFLPGLPDDLAIVCLIRVPRLEHRKLWLVSKRWFGSVSL